MYKSGKYVQVATLVKIDLDFASGNKNLRALSALPLIWQIHKQIAKAANFKTLTKVVQKVCICSVSAQRTARG